MARTDLTAQESALPTDAGTPVPVAITWVAADVANMNSVVLTGNELLLAWNTDGASAHNVTVSSSPDLKGRKADITNDSLAANAMHAYPRFGVTGWLQSDGKLYFQADNALVKFAILKLP